ncbi:glycerophosphodiester phosphodiesterase family protein [Streptomyces sp. NPDC059256]|uniref:glycerophosphodiester phosphodiesterase family protein n=1 Tax=Streptomyces sp. NPDC059256 TaxID=3346794 RepID=UPI0036814C40
MAIAPGRRSVLLAAGAAATTRTDPARAHGGGRRRPLVIGHRGAPGWRPEHTAESYALAAAVGADWLEPDLVATGDGVLVVRHENEISQTTDVREHREFRSRETSKVIDGRRVHGWFTEDFTLAELATLRTVERLPVLRNRNTVFDGRSPILTFQDVIDLTRRLARRHRRPIGLFPELKHPGYFRSIGLPLEPAVVHAVRRNRLGPAECTVQSFEPSSLRRLAAAGLGLPLWQALGTTGGPFGHDTTYARMRTPDGLREIARYARWIGPDKASVLPPSPLLADAHAAGLKVGAYTFRAENAYLSGDFRRQGAAWEFGDAFGEYALHFGLGVDAVVTDFPDLAVLARAGTAPMT